MVVDINKVEGDKPSVVNKGKLGAKMMVLGS